jgi:FkbM family methyltransferase
MVRRGGKGVLGASHAFTRDLFTCFGPLDAHAVFEDRILMFRAHLIGTIVYTPEVLVDYRIHDSNLSGKANYQDPMRWQRWIDGAINVLEHFERDHSRANGDRLAPAVASALLSERRRLEGARGIHAPGRAMRVLAAWRFAGDQSLRQRISFAIECAGWSNLPILQLTRLLKRKLLNLFSQMFEIFKTIPIKLLLILKFKILRLFILKILFRRNNLDLTYFEEKLKNRFFIFCVNNVFIASESINWYLSFDKLKKDCEDISLKFYNPMDGDTIVDIGAGRGEEIIVYSRAVGCTGKVIAVEANPQVFSVLSDIVSLNSLKNTEIINIALSAAIGKVCINDDYASYLSGAVNVRAASRKFDVDGVPFSELIRMCNLKKVDFLKVNIEGAERFLTEEVNPLVFKSVKNIAISCHDFRYRKEGSDFFRTKEMILNYFSEAGFHLKQQSTGIDYIDDWVYGSRV